MPRFLYSYLQLFSVMGHGTPEDPGGDFSMYCWIDAANAKEALIWGHALLGDYYQKRFAHSTSAHLFDGSPILDGEIESDPETIADLKSKYIIPESIVGAFPEWKAPWRISNLESAQE